MFFFHLFEKFIMSSLDRLTTRFGMSSTNSCTMRIFLHIKKAKETFFTEKSIVELITYTTTRAHVQCASIFAL